jgi:ubiquinol-cytochrome c reductase cytochrome b subunit
MKAGLDWLDERTGHRKLIHSALYERVPGGARWRYVWGSTLLFCFVVQVITGTFLWLAYSPSTQTAWESVYFIQHQMWGGWFLRGLHHYVAQAMTILLLLHLMQVVIDGAYRAPREVNFWSGIVLLLMVLALSLTGYLLPWDQKGYWATAVATNIAGISPGIGPQLQTVVVGGANYGHHTLTRFFALHAGVIPGIIIAFIVAHLWVFRRHGVTAKQPLKKPDAMFWPDQVLRDAVACLAVLLVVLFFIFRYHGAPLGAPADPSEQYSAARPEWYFLFLYQLLKYFPGKAEVFGAIILPTILMLVVVAMPFIGRWRLGHRFNVAFLTALVAGMGLLTALAMREDRNDPSFAAAVEAAKRDEDRIVELAAEGIPVTGAVTLLREDAFTQGPRIFSRTCASCHRWDGHDGLGNQLTDTITAADLKGFATREWLTGLFDATKVVTPQYWGGTALKDGDMVSFIGEHANDTPAQKEETRKVIIALSAEAGLKSQAALDQRDAALIEEGRKLIRGPATCTDCHTYRGAGEPGIGPDLTGYASREWLLAFIADPAHTRFYGDFNDRMPSFLKEKTLTEKEIGLVTDWIRGEWRVPPKK